MKSTGFLDKYIPGQLLCCLLLFVFPACKSSRVQQAADRPVYASTILANLKWSERMALTVINKNPWMVDTAGNASWGYTQALLFFSLERLWQKTGDYKYLYPVKVYGEQMIDTDGTIRGYKKLDYNLDNINGGKILFNLYDATKNEKYRKAIENLRIQLREQPRTSDGGYWHKQRYPSQMWLDGAYMATPFLAEYAARFREQQSFDEAALQLILMENHLRDERTGLLYHGWDESRSQVWANKQTGASPNFWGRAMGWYAMAIVDALDYFPKDHAKRNELINILNRLTSALEKFQDSSSGLWWQVVDQGNRKGNYLEGSASCMFVYAIAKGVHKDYLDKKYMQVAEKGFDGIIKKLITVNNNGELELLQVCEVAGLSADRDGSFEYYIREPIRINDPKGTGPFILAAIELNK